MMYFAFNINYSNNYTKNIKKYKLLLFKKNSYEVNYCEFVL